MTRAQILDAARQAVTVDRAATHGDVEDNFGRIAAYWSAHLDHSVSATDVAVMMTLLKLARLKGNPGHADNWVDGCGYLACGGEIATTAAGSRPVPQDRSGAPDSGQGPEAVSGAVNRARFIRAVSSEEIAKWWPR